jgi:adenine-specific DNA-methyltransferase
MPTNLRDLILKILPNDGTSVGDGWMLRQLRATFPDLTDETYHAAKDALVAEGVLARGRGRGGSIALNGAMAADEDMAEEASEEEVGSDAEDVEGDPSPTEPSAAPAATRRSGAAPEVVNYHHAGTRANNPEVGMVSPDNDPALPNETCARMAVAGWANL